MCPVALGWAEFNAATLVGDPAAGAIATFVGTTRDHFDGKKVLRLEYEAYIPMAEKQIRCVGSVSGHLSRTHLLMHPSPVQASMR